MLGAPAPTISSRSGDAPGQRHRDTRSNCASRAPARERTYRARAARAADALAVEIFIDPAPRSASSLPHRLRRRPNLAQSRQTFRRYGFPPGIPDTRPGRGRPLVPTSRVTGCRLQARCSSCIWLLIGLLSCVKTVNSAKLYLARGIPATVPVHRNASLNSIPLAMPLACVHGLKNATCHLAMTTGCRTFYGMGHYCAQFI